LDGLHEDVNRVLKKPYIEKEDDKEEDNLKAMKQWNMHLLRNQSVLVDLLFG